MSDGWCASMTTLSRQLTLYDECVPITPNRKIHSDRELKSTQDLSISSTTNGSTVDATGRELNPPP